MKEKEQLKKVNHILIAVLFIAQPCITMFQATVVRDIQFLGISVFESFNIIIAGISVLLTIYTFDKKKYFIKYIPYVLALGIYLILHGMNIYAFNNAIYTFQEPSFLVETYYIVRTFIVPLMLLFTLYYSGMKKDEMLGIFRVFIMIIAFSMVITNLLGVAQQNYAEDLVYCENTFFDWFTYSNLYKYSYYDITTKGWFLSGNQMAGILFMSYPVTLFLAYRKKHKIDYITAFVQGLAMFMLGTKVANVGALIILVLFIIFWILTKLVRMPANSIAFALIILVVLGVIFPFSPIGHKYAYAKNHAGTSAPEQNTMLEGVISKVEAESQKDHNEKEGNEAPAFDYKKVGTDSVKFKELDADNLSEEDRKFAKSYLYEYCSFFGISEFIIRNYDEESHMEFWVHYLQEAPNNDYRVLKTMILQNIYEDNNNPKDKYLGMGYTLNYIYTESDYSYQIYLYGIAGFVLLIGPYFVMLLCLAVKVLKRIKVMFHIETMCLCVGPAIGLAVAKFSGHIFERPFPLIVIAFLLGIALKYVQEAEAEKEAVKKCQTTII